MRYAIALRKNTYSLVKGIGLLDEGGGKRGGGIRYSDEMVLPSVCPPLVFLCVLALAIYLCSFAGSKKMKKLVGNSSARPPTLVMMMGSLILPTH